MQKYNAGLKTSDSDKVLNCIVTFYKKNGKFPLISMIETETGFAKVHIMNILKDLEADGKIKRNRSKYKVNHIKQTPKKETTHEVIKTEYKNDPKMFIFKICIFLIGVISVILSIYYNQYWFSLFTSPFISCLFSICLVGFDVIAFDAMIMYKIKKRNSIFIGLSILWIIVLIFNMLIITAGQYNQYMQSDIRKKLISNKNVNNELVVRDKQEKELLNEIDFQIKRRETINKTLELYNTVELQKKESDYINRQRYDLKNIEIKITELNNNLDKLRNNVIVYSEEYIDFFIFVNKLIGINAELLRFLTQIFPSIFLDIISSCSFALILFDKKDKDL